MVQMSSSDQAIIRAMPGNDSCMECGMKSPQWASVSFGTLFCLECSGVHRSLGVHISFVRSIAMDSWTAAQLDLMKTGGNRKCKDYLSANGVNPTTAIKPKYESPVAQHYKEMLKARATGRPEPPTPNFAAPPKAATPRIYAAGEDPNGMERLTGESDDDYVVRQTRLREEAKQRMAAKFGRSGGGMSSMGGAGKKHMAGMGSDASYNPNGNNGGVNVDSIVSGLGTAFSTFGEFGRSGIQSASAALSDQQKINELAEKAKQGTHGLWSTFSAAANDLAKTITEPEGGGDDGLSGLRAHVQQNKQGKTSTYEGFGGGGGWNSGPTKDNSNGSNNGMMNNNAASRQQPPANYGFANNKNDNVTSSAKSSAPAGDDFFANFGT